MATVPTSRKTSLASCDESLIDRSCSIDANPRNGPTNDFTSPIDEIYALIRNAYDKRIKISAKDMQDVDKLMNEMKNRIINHLLREKENPVKVLKTSEPEVQERNDLRNWPPLPSNNRDKCHSTVILKSDSDKKLESSDVNIVESKVNQMISSEKIDATIHSSFATKTGDIIIKFNERDDVQAIAKKVENNLGYKANCRSFLAPKMTISYVPKYLSLNESVTELIVSSNKWLEDMVQNGESFKVLFTYEVKDWSSVVCKVSPNVRAEIIYRRNSIKIENRLCPIKDRFHVLQCGNCLGFGHKTHLCKKDTPSCAHCGEGHRWKDCLHKGQEEKLNCSNCERTKNENASNCNSVKHSARSHSCPVYIKQLKRQIEKTSWGFGPPPNI